jgi:hypothetical protein
LIIADYADLSLTTTGITDFTHRIRKSGILVVYSCRMRYPVLTFD